MCCILLVLVVQDVLDDDHRLIHHPSNRGRHGGGFGLGGSGTRR
jgi:hypothetical protein